MSRAPVEQRTRSILVAEAAQDLLDSHAHPEESRPRVEELEEVLRKVSLTIQRPEERALRIARGCRNAALDALVHLGALRTLGRVRDGSLARTAMEASDAEVQGITANWPEIQEESGVSAKEGRLLAMLWRETNDDFEAVAQWPPVPRPDLTEIWQEYDEQVGTTTTTLLDALNAVPSDEQSRNDEHLLKWLAGGRPHETAAYKRARVTNRSTVTMVFNILLGRQLDNGGQLTGPELADAVLDHMDRATALSGGRRDCITSVIGTCPHTPGDPTMTNSAGHYDRLVGFAKRTHVRVPGDCVAYPLLRAGASDPDREKALGLIKWHRETTNGGMESPDFPIDRIRSSEVAIRAGAAIVRVLWPDTPAFQPA